MDKRRRFTGGVVMTTYTIESNCEGGAVRFDDSFVGTIQDGRLQVEMPEKEYIVSIDWSRPSYQDTRESVYENYSSQYYIFDYSIPIIGYSWRQTSMGGDGYLTVSNIDFGSIRLRRIKTPITTITTETIEYSFRPPLSKTISPGGSIYMAYISYQDIIDVQEDRREGTPTESIATMGVNKIDFKLNQNNCIGQHPLYKNDTLYSIDILSSNSIEVATKIDLYVTCTGPDSVSATVDMYATSNSAAKVQGIVVAFSKV